MDAADLLTGLDDEQLAAVLVGPEPLVVTAGAGSGKTRMLTHRVAFMVRTRQIDPARTVLTTFTKSAAGEMQERILPLLPPDARVAATTIHAWMLNLLTDHRRVNGLPPVAICDEGERKRTIRAMIGPKSKEHPDALGRKVDLSVVLGVISGWKAQLIGPGDGPVAAARSSSVEEVQVAGVIYPRFERWLARENKVDFDGILVEAHRVLSTDPDTLSRAKSRCQALFLDEAQDMNHVQHELVELIADTSSPLCMVGDGRQAIYQWRYAMPDRFLAAPARWDAQTVTLVRNYRSVPQIVDVANRVISVVGLPDMEPTRTGNGNVVAWTAADPTEESHLVARWARTLIDAGTLGADLAVLARTNAQSAPVERALFKAGVPYWCSSGSFFTRYEVADLLAYLRLGVDPTHADSLFRIINRPTRYLGVKFVEQVVKSAGPGGNLVSAMRRTNRYGSKHLSGKQTLAAAGLADLLGRLKAQSPVQAIQEVLAATDYIRWLASNEGLGGDDDTRTDNITSLLDLAREFVSIEALLRHADQVEKSMSQSADAVRISTIHRAKGSEWPHVAVIGAGSLTLPHHMAVRSGNEDEERRLAYVAVTRARDTLTVIAPHQTLAGDEQHPSPFIADMGIPLITPQPIDMAALAVDRPAWIVEGLEPDDRHPGQVSLFAT